MVRQIVVIVIMIKCCKNCPERHLHCHSTCEKYIGEKKELDNANLYLHKDDDYKDYVCLMTRRYEKKMRNKHVNIKFRSKQY